MPSLNKHKILLLIGVEGDGDIFLTQEDLSGLPYLKQCMLEAIRMRSPGVIARGVKQPMQIKVHNIQIYLICVNLLYQF